MSACLGTTAVFYSILRHWPIVLLSSAVRYYQKMLSYRHAFHAGGHADVLKHIMLVEALDYYRAKDKPWAYIDTHAGAGCYGLEGEVAGKTAEFTDGIGKLWARDDLPEAVARYVAIVRQFNPGGRLLCYPGSPALAMTQARSEDRLQLFELHTTDQDALGRTFSGERGRVRIEGRDGFSGLISALPPPSRRAVILIDPSYEIKTDYRRARDTLVVALRKFATGCFLVWYPLLARSEARRLSADLLALGVGSWLDARLQVRHPPADGLGMFGSGVFVVNPPWVLPERLEASLPWLTKTLALDSGAEFSLDYQIE